MADPPRCPGQDMRFWKPGDIFEIACPRCGSDIEFFKDEPVRPCPGCGEPARNPRIDLGCAKWCKFAEQCLGSLPEASWRVSPLPDRLIAAMRQFLGDDAARIGRATAAMERTRTMLETQPGAPTAVRTDPLVAQAAALLHEAGRDQRARDCRPGDPGSPCPVRRVLALAGVGDEAIERVCRIVLALHDGRSLDEPEFRIARAAVARADIPAD